MTFVTIDKHKRVTGTQRRQLGALLKKKYENGTSIRALADDLQRSYGFVHRLLLESGASLRGRGGSNTNLNRTPMTGTAKMAVLAALNDSAGPVSVRQVAEKASVTPATASSCLLRLHHESRAKRAGLTANKAGYVYVITKSGKKLLESQREKG